MLDEDKTFSGSFVLDLRIWWRQAHTLYIDISKVAQHRVMFVHVTFFVVKYFLCLLFAYANAHTMQRQSSSNFDHYFI